MSSSHRYTSPGSSGYGGKRPVARDRSKPVTDLRYKREDDGDNSLQHAILVEDSIVDACCDHAHAVARVHGAPEVMLEHLVHALARVPEAAEILTELGYDVDHIMRESAAIIASDIPVGKQDEKRKLYSSNDFNTVLHLAAANASRQGEAEISVYELVDAIATFDERQTAVRLLTEGRIASREYPLRDIPAQRGQTRREGRGMRRYSSNGIGGEMRSDDLLRQGFEAIELAVQRRTEAQVQRDPELHDKLSALESKINGFADQRTGELTELSEMMTKLSARDSDEQTRAVHADLIALRDTIETRDGEIGDVVKLSNGMDARLVAMESTFETRQNEMLGFNATLGKGVDEQGARLQGLESRLKSEHDETQDGLNSIRDFLEKLAEKIDQQGDEIKRLRLDHIGDMSVIGNKLGGIATVVGEMEKSAAKKLKQVREIDRQPSVVMDRPLRAVTAPKRSPSAKPLSAFKSEITRTAVTTDGDRRERDGRERDERKNRLIIDAEGIRQSFARRFVKDSGDQSQGQSERQGEGQREGESEQDDQARAVPRIFAGSTVGNKEDVGNRVRRRRSSGARAPRTNTLRTGASSLRKRLAKRGGKIKDQYRDRMDWIRSKTGNGSSASAGTGTDTGMDGGTSAAHPSAPPSWGRRFWDDVKGLFRDDDPRWTDRRK